MTIKVEEITKALSNLQVANADLVAAQEALAISRNIESARREKVNALQREIAGLLYEARRDAPPDTLWDKGQAQ